VICLMGFGWGEKLTAVSPISFSRPVPERYTHAEGVWALSTVHESFSVQIRNKQITVVSRREDTP
jgi:hypothetical protein